ncbi:LPS assembly lipoprotein LptE [Thermodesulfobacteriota bacterium]
MKIFKSRYFCYLMTLLILALFFSGCGYNFRADGTPVGINISSLAIPLIESSSSEKGFEAEFTTVLRNEFISHGRVPLKNVNEAEMTLKGNVSEIRTQPLTYNSVQQSVSGKTFTHETTSSRRLILKLNIRLIENKTGKMIWQHNSMVEEANFVVTADPLVNRHNKQEALKKIAKLLSEQVYQKTMERF